MQYIYLNLYPDFTCLAGACTATCCAGWKIVIDMESAHRFQCIDPVSLRKDILEHMECVEGEYRFTHQSEGRCSMLDQDGLCRIQRQSSEDQLCITCRKYPRLTEKIHNQIWISLAGSCPVTARYLWKDSVGFLVHVEGRSPVSLEYRDIPVVSSFMDEYIGQRQVMSSRLSHTTEDMLSLARYCLNRYDHMLDLVDSCSSVLLSLSELSYLDGAMDYFEQEELSAAQLVQDMQRFDMSCQDEMIHLEHNYMIYRSFSRYLEKPDENKEVRMMMVCGEYALLYLMAFSRAMCGKQGEVAMEELICWCYRFFAHGNDSMRQLRHVFCETFTDETAYFEIFMGLQ